LTDEGWNSLTNLVAREGLARNRAEAAVFSRKLAACRG